MQEFIAEVDPLLLVIVGVLGPALQSVLQGLTLDRRWKAMNAVLVAVVVGTLGALAVGIETREGFVAACLAAYLAGQAGYYGILRPTGADRFIEKKTPNFGPD